MAQAVAQVAEATQGSIEFVSFIQQFPAVDRHSAVGREHGPDFVERKPRRLSEGDQRELRQDIGVVKSCRKPDRPMGATRPFSS